MPRFAQVPRGRAARITDVEFLLLQAQRSGERPALWFRNRAWTYTALAEASRRYAAQLSEHGVQARERVAFCAVNSPLAVSLHYAAWNIGAVATPLSPRLTSRELLQVLEHADASVLVVGETLTELGTAVAEQWEGIVLYSSEYADTPLRALGSSRRRTVSYPHVPAPRTSAVLAYTSGTTGAPKGVLLSHENLQWAALACSQARGDTGREVGAALSPISHTPVFVSHVLCRLLVGAPVVLFERFRVADLLAGVEQYGITDLTLIGGMVHEVVSTGSLPDTLRTCVRKVTVGGAATPMADKRALRELFPAAEIIEAYGQSEATDGVTMSRGSEVFEHPGTVGRTNPHVVVRIRKPDGSFAAAGEEGEIVVGGPTVMLAYWRDPLATRATKRGPWLHTGDLGVQDQDGFLYVTGRLKNLIISGGENISPVEVEEVLREHPAVAEVAVIGTPHPKWGEQVTAAVVCRSGTRVSEEELIAFAGSRLAGFKKPRRIEFVDSLPRNATNKVDLAALRARLAMPAGSAASKTETAQAVGEVGEDRS